MERKHYDEFRAAILSKGGWAIKNQDLIVCERCHSKIHPKNKGIPDYIHVSTDNVTSFIECKADEVEWKQSLLDKDQRDYIENVLYKTLGNPNVYIAFMSGYARVDSKLESRRQLYLVPYYEICEAEARVHSATGYKYIPLNLETAERCKKRITEEQYMFSYLLKDYRLDYSNGGFVIPDTHMFLRRENATNYD